MKKGEKKNYKTIIIVSAIILAIVLVFALVNFLYNQSEQDTWLGNKLRNAGVFSSPQRIELTAGVSSPPKDPDDPPTCDPSKVCSKHDNTDIPESACGVVFTDTDCEGKRVVCGLGLNCCFPKGGGVDTSACCDACVYYYGGKRSPPSLPGDEYEVPKGSECISTGAEVCQKDWPKDSPYPNTVCCKKGDVCIGAGGPYAYCKGEVTA